MAKEALWLVHALRRKILQGSAPNHRKCLLIKLWARSGTAEEVLRPGRKNKYFGRFSAESQKMFAHPASG